MKPLLIEEARSMVGDNLKAEIDYEGCIAIEIEEPWAGDSESGFGRSGAIRLTHEDATALAVWLLAAVDSSNAR